MRSLVCNRPSSMHLQTPRVYTCRLEGAARATSGVCKTHPQAETFSARGRVWRCELRTETSQRDNKGGLLRNKRGLLENKRGLLADRGRFADIADMLTLISKSNTKKIKKGILAIYPFLINLWKLMSACQQCQRLEDFRMAHLVYFRLQMLVPVPV